MPTRTQSEFLLRPVTTPSLISSMERGKDKSKSITKRDEVKDAEERMNGSLTKLARDIAKG